MLYVTLLSSLFLLRFGVARQTRLRDQTYYLVLIGLFLFSAFRYEVGCDWTGYYYQYLAAENKGFDGAFNGREPIWWAVLAAQHYMGLSYPWANVASSTVFFAGFHVLARRQPDPLGFLILAFPILIINMPMSGIRQGAAIGLLCIALCAFIDRRTFRFVFWIILATGFHSSVMIFMLLAPLVGRGRMTAGRLTLTALLAIPGAFLILSSDAAELAIERYVEGEREAFGAVFRVGVLALSALYYFIFLRKTWAKSSPSDYSIATIGAIGMLLTGALLPISTIIANRIAYYLIPFQIMIFARIPHLPIRRNRALYVALPYLGLLLVFIVWTLTSGHFKQCYLPYQSWIGGFPDGIPFRR